MSVSKTVADIITSLPNDIDENSKSDYKVLLIGNPNTGKSTIFNNLTGLRQHTGNWTGKTVESATGEYVYKDAKITIVDLPGTYSLTSNSIDEITAIEYLLTNNCDLTVVVVDATSLERNLLLAVQIIEKCTNVLVCLNLIDEAKRKNIIINSDMLSESLGIPVICTCATNPKENTVLKNKIFDLVSNSSKNKNVLPRFNSMTEVVNYCSNVTSSVTTYNELGYNDKQHSIDKIITSKRYGVLFSLLLFGVVFFLTIFFSNYPSQLLTELFSHVNILISQFFVKINADVFVKGILADGVFRTVFWVVSVMLPPMALFFPLFTILEDYGLLPRIAFVLDYFFNKVNANGKQALTMCMGFGCNACAVTNCRIIAQKNQRLMAIVTNNFVPCNGRFPRPRLVQKGGDEY